jgi:Predicted periplasmic or secreted lipoprotein
MNISLLRSALGCTFITTILSACGAPQPTADQYPPDPPPRLDTPNARHPAQYHDDAMVTSRVQAAVLAVPGIHAENLQISTYDGVVTLKGTASHPDAAKNAVQAARQTTGVKSVDYDIQVIP